MIFLLLIISAFTAFGQPEPLDDKTKSYRFRNGESLEFKLSYGWFTIGKAEVSIDQAIHSYSASDCYKVEVTGKTTGFLGAFTHVNDEWGSYVKTDDLKPLHGYSNIEEGKYVRVEKSYFDHDAGKVEILRYDPRKEKKSPKTYEVESGVNDIMSAYLSLRNTNFTGKKKGDTIALKTFYVDELYTFKVQYDGIETIDTKVGELKAHRLYLLLPPNDIFPDKYGIVAWVSADVNQLPLKIEAEMFFGKAYCELTSYRNLKYGPDYQ